MGRVLHPPKNMISPTLIFNIVPFASALLIFFFVIEYAEHFSITEVPHCVCGAVTVGALVSKAEAL